MIFSFETQNILYVYVLLGIAFVLTVVCAVVLWRSEWKMCEIGAIVGGMSVKMSNFVV